MLDPPSNQSSALSYWLVPFKVQKLVEFDAKQMCVELLMELTELTAIFHRFKRFVNEPPESNVPSLQPPRTQLSTSKSRERCWLQRSDKRSVCWTEKCFLSIKHTQQHFLMPTDS